MRARNLIWIAIGATLLAATPGTAEQSQKAVLWTVSDGQGTIDLFWSPIDEWPLGGFRLERVVGSRAEVIAPRLQPAPELVPALSTDDQALLHELVQELARGDGAGDATGSVFLRSAVDAAVGEAAGLRAHDRGQRGERRYRVSGLDHGGAVLWSVESAAIDPAAATPPPGPPTGLTAHQDAAGLHLSWQPSAAGPGFAFRIDRAAGSGTYAALTPQPLVALFGAGTSARTFVDPDPPTGNVRYRVSWIDLFGRASDPAEVAVTVRDLAALAAPTAFEVSADKGIVSLRWRNNPSADVAGTLVERSLQPEGPFAPVGAALARGATSWADRDVRAGTAYFYRLRTRTRSSGDGEPSAAVGAVARATAPPAVPQGLRADAGRTRVALTWKPVATPVAGYLIERQTPAGSWARINPDLSQEARFDDAIGQQDGGMLLYRVTAVGFDSELGAPSRPLEVRVPDTIPPDPPRLLGIDGSDGRVTLQLTAASPSAATSQILLLRAGGPDETPLVIGDALPATARQAADPFVRAGEEYFYRLVAVDAAGNRSQPSAAMRVRVEAPPLAAPAAPEASWQSKPFPHVRLRFAEPPTGLSVVAQRRLGEQGDWLQIGAPTRATEILDVRAPAEVPSISYRIVYRDATGRDSEPSPAATVTTKH